MVDDSPADTTRSRVTLLLAAARDGDKEAASAAYAMLYHELRQLARAKLRRHRAMTLLDTTSLLHESYLRLIGAEALPVADRHHFFAYAARVMRSVIVDFARARAAERRGGEAEHLALDTALGAQIAAAPETDVLRVHEALEVLERTDEHLARIVEMRYFGGLTEQEIGDVLGISERTVRRDWEKARLLLRAALG